uniref:Uncharacterized protein n=1 Tax=Mucochytrium quahogii TaxID=96639 RepID=A0A7S2WCG8_9STRA|mmetsp:Transcript_3710/g.5393  ORF Transcript_3710/g.5393 Transcript_3710/m.5393 type:complete len:221 (+) Transcript_3710:749-1411(+)
MVPNAVFGLVSMSRSSERIHDTKMHGSTPLYKQMFAGGMSGLVASLMFNPLDLIKVRVQTAGSLATCHHDIGGLSNSQVARRIFNTEGMIGFWKGCQVNILRSIVFTSVLLSTNSRVAGTLDKFGLKDGFLRDTLGSFAGSALGIIFVNPVDVIRTRIYNQPHEKVLYNGIVDAAAKISRKEGVSAFWKGGFAHYCRVGPHTMLTFVFIGFIRRFLLETK